jgi:hypothetical protein
MRIVISSGQHRRRMAGAFAVEILGKRLLSCPTAFADSWRRCKEGLAEGGGASEADVNASERAVRQDSHSSQR